MSKSSRTVGGLKSEWELSIVIANGLGLQSRLAELLGTRMLGQALPRWQDGLAARAALEPKTGTTCEPRNRTISRSPRTLLTRMMLISVLPHRAKSSHLGILVKKIHSHQYHVLKHPKQ